MTSRVPDTLQNLLSPAWHTWALGSQFAGIRVTAVGS
jgi:hypothetical protein